MKVLSYPVFPDLFSIWFASFTSDPILTSQFGRAVCVRFGGFSVTGAILHVNTKGRVLFRSLLTIRWWQYFCQLPLVNLHFQLWLSVVKFHLCFILLNDGLQVWSKSSQS